MTGKNQRSQVLLEVEKYYSQKVQLYGRTAQGVDWKDAESHEIRHQQFLRLISNDLNSSIADLGCGYGDFLRFLRAHNFKGRYVGYDLCSDMLKEAAVTFPNDHLVRWRQCAKPTETSDYIVASGIFNVKGGTDDSVWRDYVLETINAMFEKAQKGFGFNCLSMHSDPGYRRSNLYYADPAWYLEYCARNFGRHITVLQDYGLYEFTLTVRKN